MIRRAGLEIHGAFMIGGPHDTRESLLGMIPTIRAMDLSVVTFNKVFAWPGTALGREPQRLGLFYTEDEYWYEREGWLERHPFHTRDMSPDQIDSTAKELYHEFLA